MSTSNRTTRAAWFGLAVVVLSLAGFSIFAAYTTQTRVVLAQESDSLAHLYEDAIDLFHLEETNKLLFLLDPSPDNVRRLDEAGAALAVAVNRITVEGGEEDAELAEAMLVLHAQYLVAAERLVGAMGAGDRTAAAAIDETEARPPFLAMEDRLTAATERRLAAQHKALTALAFTAQWVLIAAPVVFAIGFVLLLLLGRILQQNARATQKTYQKVEQLSKLRAEFVGTVSHEFRTPLTGIQGFSEMMRDEQLTLDLMREYAGDINKDAQRLNRLINDMLDLDQLEAGLMTMKAEPVDLNRIVVDAAAMSAGRAAGHSIELDLDEGMPKLTGDVDRLTQVVTNLLSNAIKYSPDGGAVELRTKGEEQTLLLTVRDHGIGIPAAQLESIFERYSRIQTIATPGTGLGLAIVRQIVQLYRGKVWATSEPGEGSVFHVRLPVEAAA